MSDARITITVNGPGGKPAMFAGTTPPVVCIDMQDTVLNSGDMEILDAATACAQRLLAALGIAPHQHVTLAELDTDDDTADGNELDDAHRDDELPDHADRYTDGDGYTYDVGDKLGTMQAFVALCDDDEPPGAHRVGTVLNAADATEAYDWLGHHHLPRHIGDTARWAMFTATTLDEFKDEVRNYRQAELNDNTDVVSHTDEST